MSLNWIVPARRLVVATETATYADVLEGWLAELREHRDVLVGWYRGLQPGLDLEAGFDRALRFAQAWVENFTTGPGDDVELAAAPGDENNIDEHGFWARLWDGPLRVLLHAEAERETEPAEVPEGAPIRTEFDHNGPVVVTVDRQQRTVLNHDARFLPGDILEFPIFRVFELSGISAFARASFDPDGSCFEGTTVRDSDGRHDGGVWLHDNLVAMRFQLLLGAARGAFYSLESGFSDDDQTRKTHPVELEGRTVHARGVIYGGSLAPPHMPTYYRLHDHHWGDKNVPTSETLSGFASPTRLTTGWACSPCALALLTFMGLHPDSWGGGSVNRHARGANESGAWARALVEYDHFHHTFRQCGGEAGLRLNAERIGLSPEESTTENVRAFALQRMFGQRLNPLPPEDPEDDEDDEPAAPPGVPPSVPPSEAALERDHAEAAAAEDTEPDLDPTDESLEPHTHAPTLNVAEVLPDDEVVSRSKEDMLRYLEGAAFAAVGLNGHEYSWVVVHDPRALLDLPVQTIAGHANRPPRAGPISAFDPLSGEPQAVGDTPELYIFEATGSFYPYRLRPARDGEEGFGYTVFKVRPFRWSKVDRVLFKRTTRTRTQRSQGQRRRVQEETSLNVGEDATFTRRPDVRAKQLLSISRVPLKRLVQRHCSARTFAPLYLHTVRGRGIQRERVAVCFSTRALPFATLAESSEDTRFSTLADARATSERHREHLRAHLAELNALKRRADRLSAADIRLLEARIPGNATYARLVDRKKAALRSTHDAETRAREGTIRTLRRMLARHCDPDAGSTPEQVVHERASYRRLLAASLDSLPEGHRETPRERTARTRERRWQRRAEQYERARREDARQVERTDSQWASAARRAVIIEWAAHVRQMMNHLA